MLSSLSKVEFAQKQIVVYIIVAIGVPLQISTTWTKIAKVVGVHWWKCFDNGIWQGRLSWERGIHFLMDRHLGSQDEGRLYKEISQGHYGLDLRRGGVVGGMDIHKLVTNKAKHLTNMGVCDHDVSWVDQIRSQDSITSSCESQKRIIWICNMHLPKHVELDDVCQYGCNWLEKSLHSCMKHLHWQSMHESDWPKSRVSSKIYET